MAMTKWTVTKTDRGFERCEFRDHDDQPCSLQQSSAINTSIDSAIDNPGTSYVWLGIDSQGCRMHLSRDQALLLMHSLSLWLQFGTFIDPQCIESFDCNAGDHSDACPVKVTAGND
jgi:hypothetical protein